MPSDFNLRQHVDFEDTSTAFGHLSSEELKRRLRLFRLMNNSRLTKVGTFIVNLLLKAHFPVESLLKNTLYQQFVGGADIDEARQVMNHLAEKQVKVILDYAQEGHADEDSYDRTRDELLLVYEEAQRSGHIPFVVVKPSALASFDLMVRLQAGHDLSVDDQHAWERAKARYHTLAQRALETGVPFMVDAEETWMQQPVDELVWQLMREYNTEKPLVFNTLQMYRRDSMDRLRLAFHKAATHQHWLGIKLVRGAYMHKEARRARQQGYENPIQPSKEATDAAYDKALAFCVDNKQRVAVVNGSHNEYSNYLLTLLMDKHSMKPGDGRVWFCQLYGMSEHISFNLAAGGYNVAKYLPYGPPKMLVPYLTRRAQENSAVAGQSSRELQLLRRERQRRS